MKLDLDAIERKTRAAQDRDDAEWAPSHRETLAMIARIRELEEAVLDLVDKIDGYNPSRASESTREMRALIEKGAVIP